MSLVSLVIAASISLGDTTPLSGDGGNPVTLTPCRSSFRSGRTSELCPMQSVTTWSPGFRNPFSPRFKASVQFRVNITRLVSETLIKRATKRLVSSTVSLAAKAMLLLPRPGFPPFVLRNASIVL